MDDHVLSKILNYKILELIISVVIDKKNAFQYKECKCTVYFFQAKKDENRLA